MPQEAQRGNLQLYPFLTSELDAWAEGGKCNIPAALPMGKRPGAHCRKGWVGPRYAKESLQTDYAIPAPDAAFVL